jgi:hypothetical protein
LWAPPLCLRQKLLVVVALMLVGSRASALLCGVCRCFFDVDIIIAFC